ncbi:MAG TPA: nucleotide sugar dehydrogenase [Solirubrobacterales bacterium]|nr:nucleotide sugar dehydrogenase [Solirubrobacterales bacterium]
MRIGIVGLGYVGLPLAGAFAEAGHEVVGLDADARKVASLNEGRSYVEDVPDAALAPLLGRLHATSDYADLAPCEAIVICVPTPLTGSREPDLTCLTDAATALAEVLRPGQLVVLESTTYPGTTREVLRPILEAGGLRAGTDFHLAMSPERIDPGRTDYTIRTTPKVVGGLTPACLERALDLYGACCDHLVPVSSCDAAELTKLLENIFRSVNIALVNELAMLCDRMALNVWEVVAAAATKPYGFMPFQPGPGLGGHCLPIDPFYLAWKARELDFPTEFIELAGKVNQHMPYYCAERVARALNGHHKAVAGSSVLVLGVAYKGNVGDLRESPALKLIGLLQGAGAEVTYHDPFVPVVAEEGLDLASVELSDDLLEAADAVCVVTAHGGIDYARVADRARLVVDFRNAVPAFGDKVVKL